MSRYGNEKEIRKAMKSPRKFIFTLEEIIDMLAKLDDDGHGDKMVQVEGSIQFLRLTLRKTRLLYRSKSFGG
jgi:hypothetical protein